MRKTVDIIGKNIKWIVLVLSVIILIEMIEGIFQNEIHHFDNAVYQFIKTFINESMTDIFIIITAFGSAIVIIPITIICFCISKNKEYPKYITLNLIISFVTNQLLKLMFIRQRPIDIQLVQETGYSFPSGHSMVSLAFYGFFIYLVYKKVKNPYLKWGSLILLSILILLIGVSRIYLGVHYASDVVAGFCFGFVYLVCFINIISDKKIAVKGEKNGASN